MQNIAYEATLSFTTNPLYLISFDEYKTDINQYKLSGNFSTNLNPIPAFCICSNYSTHHQFNKTHVTMFILKNVHLYFDIFKSS